jgi:hypothetical protein
MFFSTTCAFLISSAMMFSLQWNARDVRKSSFTLLQANPFIGGPE